MNVGFDVDYVDQYVVGCVYDFIGMDIYGIGFFELVEVEQ